MFLRRSTDKQKIIGALIVLVAFWGISLLNNRDTNSNLSDRITVEGTLVCLPSTAEIATTECTYGIMTPENKYYGLNFDLLSTFPDVGESDLIFSASGLFVPLEQISTGNWNTYPIEGVISVTEISEEL